MHQDIIDALNLAGRRRGYDDGGMVADEMMSDDPTQQFMANLARAGFTQDQINSIIGSQSPQTNQTPSQQIQMPQYQYIPNQPAEGSRIVMNAPPSAPMGDDPRTAPWNRNDPTGGGPDVQYPMGGTGTKAGGGSPQPIPDPSYPGHSLGYRPMPPQGYFPNQGAPGNPQYPPMGGGMGGQMTPEEWSRTYGPNVDPDPRMIRQDPSQGNLGGMLNTAMGGLGRVMGGGMGGGAPIQGAYGNPQYAPLGGGLTNSFAPNMPGGYGAPPYGGGAGHKGGSGHKGGGYGGMFGG